MAKNMNNTTTSRLVMYIIGALVIFASVVSAFVRQEVGIDINRTDIIDHEGRMRIVEKSIIQQERDNIYLKEGIEDIQKNMVRKDDRI